MNILVSYLTVGLIVVYLSHQVIEEDADLRCFPLSVKVAWLLIIWVIWLPTVMIVLCNKLLGIDDK